MRSYGITLLAVAAAVCGSCLRRTGSKSRFSSLTYPLNYQFIDTCTGSRPVLTAGYGVSTTTPPAEDLGLQVKNLFSEFSCNSCHNPVQHKANINDIFNYGELQNKQLLDQRNPKDSILYRQLATGQMPFGPNTKKMNASQLAIVERWLATGSPIPGHPSAGTNRPTDFPFISNESLVACILKNVEALPARTVPFVRYFTLTNIYNAGNGSSQTTETLALYREAFSRLVNSLSYDSEITLPDVVDAYGTVLRIDLRRYRNLSSQSWEQLGAWNSIVSHDRYAVKFKFDQASQLYSLFSDSIPYSRVDQFMAAAAVPPLYHDLLGIPATDKELENILGVNVLANIDNDQVKRAGISGNKSAVAVNNRVLERHSSRFGFGSYYWKSYDFLKTGRQQNVFVNPLGPCDHNYRAGVYKYIGDCNNVSSLEKAEAFIQDGGEIIFSLPNGLQGYMIVDANGKRLDKADVNIVTDKNREVPEVVNGLSCMGCHIRWMRRATDQLRPHVEAHASSFANADKILTLFPKQSILDDSFKRDEDRYAASVNLAGGQVRANDSVFSLVRHFLEDEIDIATAAAELGLKTEDFRDRFDINKVAATNRVLGRDEIRQLRDAIDDIKREIGPLFLGDKITRQTLEQAFIRAVQIAFFQEINLVNEISGNKQLAQDANIRAYVTQFVEHINSNGFGKNGKCSLTVDSAVLNSLRADPQGRFILKASVNHNSNRPSNFDLELNLNDRDVLPVIQKALRTIKQWHFHCPVVFPHSIVLFDGKGYGLLKCPEVSNSKYLVSAYSSDYLARNFSYDRRQIQYTTDSSAFTSKAECEKAAEVVVQDFTCGPGKDGFGIFKFSFWDGKWYPLTYSNTFPSIDQCWEIVRKIKNKDEACYPFRVSDPKYARFVKEYIINNGDGSMVRTYHSMGECEKDLSPLEVQDIREFGAFKLP